MLRLTLYRSIDLSEQNVEPNLLIIYVKESLGELWAVQTEADSAFGRRAPMPALSLLCGERCPHMALEKLLHSRVETERAPTPTSHGETEEGNSC